MSLRVVLDVRVPEELGHKLGLSDKLLVIVTDNEGELEDDKQADILTVPHVDPEGERDREGEDDVLLEGVTV